jgi:hypothetical protein
MSRNGPGGTYKRYTGVAHCRGQGQHRTLIRAWPSQQVTHRQSNRYNARIASSVPLTISAITAGHFLMSTGTRVGTSRGRPLCLPATPVVECACCPVLRRFQHCIHARASRLRPVAPPATARKPPVPASARRASRRQTARRQAWPMHPCSHSAAAKVRAPPSVRGRRLVRRK